MGYKIEFKDDGQDILWWKTDDQGVVQECNMQEWVWKGTRVVMTDAGTKLDDIKPEDKLLVILPGEKKATMFIHPVDRVATTIKVKVKGV
jgi:hypothetical protein